MGTATLANLIAAVMTERISVSARRELVVAVAERYRTAKRDEKGRILDEPTAVTGWHRKHAVRALSANGGRGRQRRCPQRTYGEPVRDALIALWEASDRVHRFSPLPLCGTAFQAERWPACTPHSSREIYENNLTQPTR
jgi:hypothetical protein